MGSQDISLGVRTRARRLLFVALTAALLAGCTTVDGAADRAAEPTREDTATAYLALVGPLNARLRELGARVDATRALDEMQAIALGYAAVENEFRQALLALDVPADLRDEARAAADAAERVAKLDRAAAVSPEDAQRLGT